MSDVTRFRNEVKNLSDGAWIEGIEQDVLPDKYTDEPITLVHRASVAQVADAAAAVAQAQAEIEWPTPERFTALTKAADLVAERRVELASLVVDDTGFTITDAIGEIARTRQTLTLSAQAATSLVGELVPMESTPGVRDRFGYTIRMPLGVVGAITPFNSPINTVAHKIAPALAAGNGFVLKPAEQSPASAQALVRLLIDAGVPARLMALVNGPGRTVGEALIHNQNLGFLTFTGSTAVGEIVQAAAGLRPTQLELGSIASTLVCEDADLPAAARKIVQAGFRKAGQVCTSVQRLYLQRTVYDTFLELMTKDLDTRIVGDPRDPATFLGPMISHAAAERVESWVGAAVQGGATILYGGGRDGAMYQPTVLADVPVDANVLCREVFGPLVSVIAFDELDDAITQANNTPYGLAAGVFTRDIGVALRAGRRLRFGGVHINEASASRVDLMPFGGVKGSGHGKEGPLYAAREMTEERVITISY